MALFNLKRGKMRWSNGKNGKYGYILGCKMNFQVNTKKELNDEKRTIDIRV